MKRSMVLTRLVALALLVVISGCSGKTTAPSAAGDSASRQLGGMLNVSISADPGTLDPHKATLITAIEVMAPIYDRLVYIDEQGAPQPWLAQSWNVSQDGKEITFNLRQGVKFHDGTDFNAEAVKFTLDRAMDPKLNSRARTSIPDLERTDVVDAYTVKLTFKKPFASVFTMLDHSFFSIVSPAAVKSLGDDFGRKPVGTGPFMMQSYDPGAKVVLVRNPDYKNFRKDVKNTGPVLFEGITFKVVAEEGTAVSALRSGDLDLSEAPREDLSSFRTDGGFTVAEWKDATNWSFVEFNTHKPPFDDRRVRRAVGYALDRNQVVATAWSGFAQPIQSVMPVGVPGYSESVARQAGFSYDVNQARQLLDEAGWKAGPDGVRAKQGQALEVIFHTYNNSAAIRAAQNIQYQLEQVGFKVKLVTLETGTLIAGLPKGEQHLNFMRWTWPDPNILTRMFKTPGWSKQYGNPTIDPVLDKINEVLDWGERKKHVEEAQKLLLEDAAAVPIATDFRVAVMRNGIEGYRWDNGGIPLYYDLRVPPRK